MTQKLTEMLELTKKIKAVFITVFHVFKKFSRDMGDRKNNKIKLLNKKTTMYENKNTLDGINIRLDNKK